MRTRIIIAALLLACAARAQEEWDYGIGQLDQCTRGLVAYSAMRNSGTTVYDQWGGFDGTATNGVTFGTEHAAVGYGASFDGANDCIVIPSSTALSLTTAFSLTAWIKINSVTNYYDIVGKWDNGATQLNQAYILTVSLAKARVMVSNNGENTGRTILDSTVDLVAGQWTFIAATYSGTTLSLYVNDGTAKTASHTGGAEVNTQQVIIGAHENDNALIAFMNGLIDEVRIFNVAKTAGEVKQLYRMGATPRGIK